MVLAIFINFIAAPTVAMVFGFELPQSNMMLFEEETHSNTLTVVEKAIPKTIHILDFLNLENLDSASAKKVLSDENTDLSSPHISIFAPPPEA